MRARPASWVLVLAALFLLGGACAKGTGSTLSGGGGQGGGSDSSTRASSGADSGASTGSSGGATTSSQSSATTSTTSGTTVKCDPLTCNNCPCTSTECIMCCAYKQKVNACNASGCYCY